MLSLLLICMQCAQIELVLDLILQEHHKAKKMLYQTSKSIVVRRLIREEEQHSVHVCCYSIVFEVRG